MRTMRSRDQQEAVQWVCWQLELMRSNHRFAACGIRWRKSCWTLLRKYFVEQKLCWFEETLLAIVLRIFGASQHGRLRFIFNEFVGNYGAVKFCVSFPQELPLISSEKTSTFLNICPHHFQACLNTILMILWN